MMILFKLLGKKIKMDEILIKYLLNYKNLIIEQLSFHKLLICT